MGKNSAVYTVIHKANDIWDKTEIHALINKIGASVSQDEKLPDYLILFGSYSHNRISKELPKDCIFSVNEFTEEDGPEAFPFKPKFK